MRLAVIIPGQLLRLEFNSWNQNRWRRRGLYANAVAAKKSSFGTQALWPQVQVHPGCKVIYRVICCSEEPPWQVPFRLQILGNNLSRPHSEVVEDVWFFTPFHPSNWKPKMGLGYCFQCRFTICNHRYFPLFNRISVRQKIIFFFSHSYQHRRTILLDFGASKRAK